RGWRLVRKPVPRWSGRHFESQPVGVPGRYESDAASTRILNQAPLSVTPQPPARSTSGSGGWRRGTPTEAAPAPPPGPPTGSHKAPVDPQRVEGDTLLLACWGSSGTSSGAGRTLAAQTTRTHRQADPAVQSKRSEER